MANCELCKLSVRNFQTQGRGKLPCDFLFIAESPGQIEFLIRKAYVGKNRIIDDVLRSAEITNYYLTYMVRCCPYDLTPEHFREVTKAEILKCQQNLLNLVSSAMPGVIVFIGKLVEQHYRIHFPNAITILDLDFLTRSGGKGSPYWRETIIKLERAKHAIFHN